MEAKKKIVSKNTSKLSTYRYESTNSEGKTIHGEIKALNLNLAKASIRKQGLHPIKVQRQSQPFVLFGKKKVSSLDICSFSRQMSTMVTAGIPLVQSLEIVSKSSDNPIFQELVTEIKTEIEAGRPFAEALRKFPLYFDELFCNLVSAGEASGSLDNMLDRVATYQEKSESLKRKLKKAIIYPLAVVSIAVIVTAILLIFVVPQFEQLFKGFGAQLPTFTLCVISLSKFVQHQGYLIVASAVGLFYTFKYFKKSSKTFRDFLDRMILKIPIVGNIIHTAALARYARTLSTTFAAGVPLVEALEAVAGATGNIVYCNAILQVRNEVITGSQMQAAMKNAQIFPNMMIQMVAVGEESGTLESMLAKVASIYEEEVDTAVDGLSSLLEPLIMSVLGVLVGGLVIAMYLPIFKMGSVI